VFIISVTSYVTTFLLAGRNLYLLLEKLAESSKQQYTRNADRFWRKFRLW